MSGSIIFCNPCHQIYFLYRFRSRPPKPLNEAAVKFIADLQALTRYALTYRWVSRVQIMPNFLIFQYIARQHRVSRKLHLDYFSLLYGQRSPSVAKERVSFNYVHLSFCSTLYSLVSLWFITRTENLHRVIHSLPKSQRPMHYDNVLY